MWATFKCIMKNVFRVFFQFSVNLQFFLYIHIREKDCRNTNTKDDIQLVRMAI